ncbi:MAG: primosomal protein N' [Betaproteobacteria bacterium]|nr:primosomal protein N' [Betaproteobacteria bacterium]
MSIVRVALDVPLPRLFDYACAEELNAGIGERVVVPFGTRRLVGVVVERVQESSIDPAKIKRVERLLDNAPALPADWIEMMRFLSGYYQRPLGETILAALPPRLRSLKPLPGPDRVFWQTSQRAPSAQTLSSGRKRELLARIALVGPVEEAALLSSEQTARSAERAALRALAKAGWIDCVNPPGGARFVAGHPLTPTQNAVLQRILRTLGDFSPFLLHGVTGSGKTEIYLHLIAEVIRQGRQALILVPEIGLTPQLEARFRSAFPDAVISLLHSGLEESARTSGWLRAARGEAGIVLGTRLAVLAPLPHLALVIVDEEHDSSFKQHEGLRYSGRDAAVFRARQAAVPIVLGTATPSLETYANTLAGRYTLVELPERASPGARMPVVRSVDLRDEPEVQGFAPSLTAALRRRLERGEQSLVFINRRGYAPVLACSACGWMAGCSRCTARLVLHSSDRRMRCHHCGLEEPIPRACPQCGNVDLHPLGRGTQRVEETLAAHFPNARLVRIDRDTARRKSLSGTLETIRGGGADILIGTQMIAKGHDFPGLTLVCVLNADSALVSTDYRAGERLFATLMQVAGRAGRRERQGEVLVQTRFPGHPLYAALARHDYAGFARSQLAEREAAGFPPSVFEASLRAESGKLADSLRFLREAAELVEAPQGVRIYDPVPHVITRRANLERAQLLVQSRSRPAMQGFLHAWNEALFEHASRNVRWHLDVDPIEFD